ncbi:MAG: class I SAM-dependent methyltransferase [Pseudomonadota bacterium]
MPSAHLMHATTPDSAERDNIMPVFSRWLGSWQISVQRRVLSAEELSEVYDREAGSWDSTIQQFGFPTAYEAMLQHAIPSKVLAPSSGEPLRVLDAGIGSGGLSKALANVCSAPLQLSGCDISTGMLEAAEQSLRQLGLSAELIQNDVQALPYATGQFDIVMAAHVLEHLVDPHRALSEMVRVLKPGGILIACLTRRSSLGAYVQWKWRTHNVSNDQARSWLAKHKLEAVRCISFEGVRCRKLSVACVGRKPLT